MQKIYKVPFKYMMKGIMFVHGLSFQDAVNFFIKHIQHYSSVHDSDEMVANSFAINFNLLNRLNPGEPLLIGGRAGERCRVCRGGLAHEARRSRRRVHPPRNPLHHHPYTRTS